MKAETVTPNENAVRCGDWVGDAGRSSVHEMKWWEVWLKSSVTAWTLATRHDMPETAIRAYDGWVSVGVEAKVVVAVERREMVAEQKAASPTAEVSDSGLGKPTISGQTAAPAVRLH